MEELLEFFKWNEVSIQITLDVGKSPVVDAIDHGKFHRTEHETLEGALELMKTKLMRRDDGV